MNFTKVCCLYENRGDCYVKTKDNLVKDTIVKLVVSKTIVKDQGKNHKNLGGLYIKVS